MEKFRLLVIADPGCEVATRYRVEQYRAGLDGRGIGLSIENWPREERAREILLARAADVNAVLFQRLLPPIGMIGRFRKASRRLLYDFDDAVIYVESGRRRVRLRPIRWLRFRAMVRSCDQVTAGNSYLAKLASDCRATRVSIVPTTVDLARYLRESQVVRDEPPVLGWIGGRWTLPYLEQLREPLAVLAEQDNVRVRVIADQPGRLSGVDPEWVRWDAATEVHELKRLTVGLAPLPDDPWTRGKCGLRLLQYMAAGVPAVASPVGTQAELTAGNAALAARYPDDWVAAVRSLLAVESVRREMSVRGLEVVRRGYDLALWEPQVARLWCGNCG